MPTPVASSRLAILRIGSLAFVWLLFLPLARADAESAAPDLWSPHVTLTGHELPPHEVGTLPTRPQGLTLPRFPAMEEVPRWGRLDRSLATSYLVLSGIDAWQTGNLPEGFREGNPLVSSWAGDRPTLGKAVAFKAVMGWGALELTRRLERPAHRRTVLLLINVVQASVVAMNERRTGGILFR
jgi:hypothetical protein